MSRAPLPAVRGLARTAGLPPPPPRPAVSPPSTVEPATAQDETAYAPTGTAGAARVSDSAKVVRHTTLSLPADVVRRLKDRAHADRTSQPEVIMDALSSVHQDLAELLAERSQEHMVSDGLFVRRASRGGANEPLASLSLRMLSSNVEAIDELVALHQAPSRSALCLVALQAYLAT